MNMRYIFLKIVVILFLGFSVGTAENVETLYQLYYKGDFKAIQEKLQEFQNENSADIQFFRALFTENGDTAVDMFLSVFEQARGDLKNLAGHKLYQYYYATGYYITAEKYKSFEIQHSEPAVAEIPSSDPPQQIPLNSDYVIQLGAFSAKANADLYATELNNKGLQAVVVEREVNSTSLYCVWLDGKMNYSQTLKYAEILKDKHKFNYRILER